MPASRRCASRQSVRRCLTLALVCSLFAACGAPGAGAAGRPGADKPAGEGARVQQALPQRNVTNFSPALRCMDDLMFAFGTRDVTIMLEELQDKTGRIGAGTRDMMISALSEMTRRSRGIKVITFGSDGGNLVNLLQIITRSVNFGVVPQYDIRGSVTQFDEDVLKKQAAAGFSIPALLGFQVGSNVSLSVLGFDASVVTTEELALLPGVNSKNTVVIRKQDDGATDGQAQIRKAGINFSLTVNRSESLAQGLRSMIELASVELVGRLLRLPYWQCLDIAVDNAEIVREREDWFVSMRGAELRKYFQEQLRLRKFYDGELNGADTDALRRAVAAYRASLNMSPVGTIDQPFFEKFLDAPVSAAPAETFAEPRSAVAPPGVAANGPQGATPEGVNAAAPRSVPVPAPASVPAAALATQAMPSVSIYATKERLKPGESFDVLMVPQADLYAYCYVRNEAGGIQRIFPNRFVSDPRVRAGKAVLLPGRQRFRLDARRTPGEQQLACLGASREIYNDLPPPLRWGDFEDIRVDSFEKIREGFERVSGSRVSLNLLTIPVAP